MAPNAKRVLDVGQCNLDHGNLTHLLTEAFGADVERAHTGDEAMGAVRAGHFDLVLVNRVLDADGASGLDLIAQLQRSDDTAAAPTMLVSNFADAQKAAVALGARAGFGKNALGSPQTRELLAPLLAGES